MFDINKAVYRADVWVCAVLMSNAEIISLLISLLVSYFITMIMTITGMFKSIAIHCELQISDTR